MSLIQEINQENFSEKVLQEKQPVLVDFYTDRCSSCEALNPILEELSESYEGQIKIKKMYVSIDDVLENKNKVAIEYDVMSFPTVLFIKNGKVVTTLMGGQNMDTLVKEIEAIL